MYEYRHVVLPQDIAKRLPKDKLLSEPEWRALGVQQSRGWGTLLLSGREWNAEGGCWCRQAQAQRVEQRVRGQATAAAPTDPQPT